MPWRRARSRAIAGLTALALASLAGCGSEEEAPLTPVEVTRLEASIEAIRQSVATRDREAAFSALRQMRGDVEALDRSGDSAQVRQVLLTGIQRTKQSLSKVLAK